MELGDVIECEIRELGQWGAYVWHAPSGEQRIEVAHAD